MVMSNIVFWGLIFALVATVIYGLYQFRDYFKSFLPFIVVDAQEAVVIDNRIGKDRVVTEGISHYIPGVEVIAKKLTLKEHPADPPKQEIVTSDNITIEVDMIAMMKIIDPLKAAFAVEDYKSAIESLVSTSTRKRLGTRELNEIKAKQSEIAERIKEEINVEMQIREKWGVEITLVEFEAIDYSKSVKEAMEKELIAEKEKKAAILKAEGEHKVLELQADSERILIEQRAKATKNAIKELKELMPDLPNSEIMEFLTKNAYIDSMKELSASKNSKFVLFPSQADLPMDKVIQTEYLSKGVINKDKE